MMKAPVCRASTVKYVTRNPSLAAAHTFLSLQPAVPAAATQQEEEGELSCLLDYSSLDEALEVSFHGEGIPRQEKPFRLDLQHVLQRQAQARQEVVVKAVGKAPIVVDMTAGLGRDAMVLASAGKRVVAVEAHPVLHLLLSDALKQLRARGQPNVILDHLTLLHGRAEDCVEVVKEVVAGSQEVSVYLDPMYPTPPAARKSLVKKETQVLHRLVDSSARRLDDERRLFAAACQVATDRVVVKRGLHDPVLMSGGGEEEEEGTTASSSQPLCSLPPQPHLVVKGSKQRFDVYFMNQMSTSVRQQLDS
eukprot:scaffold523_cov171-Ochromonas_danica.AAC.4